MTGPGLERVLREAADSAADPARDPALEALRTAVLLEDVFGVALTDDELDPAVLGDPVAVRRLLRERGIG